MMMKIATKCVAALALSMLGEAVAQGPVEGLKIPSGGNVEIISVEQLPPAAASMTKTQQKESKSAVGFIEYVEPDDRQVEALDSMVAASKPMAKHASNIAVRLAKLGTPFNDFKAVGFLPEGSTLEGPWTRVARVFKREDGSVVRLSEWDFKADDGGILLIKEFLNQDVNGSPATLTLSTGKSGGGLWSLTWAKDSKHYTLDLAMRTNVASGKDQILSLARSLSD